MFVRDADTENAGLSDMTGLEGVTADNCKEVCVDRSG